MGNRWGVKGVQLLYNLPCPGGPVLIQVAGGLTVWLTTVTTPLPPTVTRVHGGGPAVDGLVVGTLVTTEGPLLLLVSSTERSGHVKFQIIFLKFNFHCTFFMKNSNFVLM